MYKIGPITYIRISQIDSVRYNTITGVTEILMSSGREWFTVAGRHGSIDEAMNDIFGTSTESKFVASL